MLNPEITVHAKALYVVLKLFADKSGRCFPNRQTLAEALGVTKSSITRHLAELENCGIITRNLVAGKGTVYTIHDQQSDILADDEEEELEEEIGDELGVEMVETLRKNEQTPYAKMSRGMRKNEQTPYAKMSRGMRKNEQGYCNTTNQQYQLTTPTTEECVGVGVDTEERGEEEGPEIEPIQFPIPTDTDIMAYAAQAGLHPLMAIEAWNALVEKGYDQRRNWQPWVSKGARLRMRSRAAQPTEVGAEFFDDTDLAKLRAGDMQVERKLEHWETPDGMRYRYPSERDAPTGWKIIRKPKIEIT